VRIQLWSYNYDPEPTGIAPLMAAWVRAMTDRGHEVEVVAAHPHYPDPRWGTRIRPYREIRDDVPVLRLPIWPGRASAAQRVRQELSFVGPLSACAPFLAKPDVLVAVSPSFPGLGPAMAFSRLRRVPWVLWLQDILPDGATATGVMREGALIRAARRFEQSAYTSASRILVISESFEENLLAKGVPGSKLKRIYNPATRPIRAAPRRPSEVDERAVLNMGNIGHTQNLVRITSAFEANADLEKMGATLTMAGDGVAGDEVRRAIRTDRVRVTGIVDPPTLDRLLASAAVGLVSQTYDGIDFNVPSKLMNFMGQGIPVVAAVRADSEVARVVKRAGAGWVTTSPEEVASTLARVLSDSQAREQCGAAALDFATSEFSPAMVAERVEAVLIELAPFRGRTASEKVQLPSAAADHVGDRAQQDAYVVPE
jgi:colanic acid biosynthesis glycosyl transferase WcaI